LTVAPTVLVIDDVDATRSGLAQLLRLRRFRALEAANGEDGLRLLRQEPAIRVVVLDLMMPTSNGYWFREQQLKDPTVSHIPVIVFTGAADIARVKEQLHVSDVLAKPISVDALMEAIGRCCGV
jgi:CheY-like chemotaxis protein